VQNKNLGLVFNREAARIQVKTGFDLETKFALMTRRKFQFPKESEHSSSTFSFLFFSILVIFRSFLLLVIESIGFG